jgi:hypothetical protein
MLEALQDDADEMLDASEGLPIGDVLVRMHTNIQSLLVNAHLGLANVSSVDNYRLRQADQKISEAVEHLNELEEVLGDIAILVTEVTG